MIRLSGEELEAQAEEFNHLVLASKELDRFCSSTHWILPAHQAFAPSRPLWIRRSEAGYTVLARSDYPRYGSFLEPLEAVWGFACPLVGDNLPALAHDFSQEFLMERDQPSSGRTAGSLHLLLGGILPGGELFRLLYENLSPYLSLLVGMSSRRHRARLEGGVEGYLSRRTPKFRSNLRRSQRLARADEVRFEYFSQFSNWNQALSVYNRILHIEKQSWKGRSGTGLVSRHMQQFYRLMMGRLWHSQALRIILAQREEKDIGFVLGAVLGKEYRGLQISFDQQFHRLSPGNLLQWEMIQRLCEEGCQLYDLGMEVPYKEYWGEEVLETVQLMDL